MPEPLKNSFGATVVHAIADRISTVYSEFKKDSFIATTLHGYDALELMPRSWKIARSLHLYCRAILRKQARY